MDRFVRILELVGILSLLLSPLAFAVEQSGHYKVKQKTVSFTYDTELVVLPFDYLNPDDQNSEYIESTTLTASKGLSGLFALKSSVLPNNGFRTFETQLGHPIWFNKEFGSVGILTSEIVVQLLEPRGIVAVYDYPGVIDIKESRFKEGLLTVSFSNPEAALNATYEISNHPLVKFAHPNFILPKEERAIIVNDDYYLKQWHLNNTGQNGGSVGADINIEKAWQYTQGDASIRVAILDGGVETDHPDLVDGWQVNENEIPNNQKDDDNNGLVDDYYGWNFSINSNNIDYDQKHGTSVAGLVGARRNNIGVIGVCPKCSMIPIAVGFTPVKDAEAFYYALARGADIITNSWGYSIGTQATEVVEDAIDYVAKKGRSGKGTVILFAMNNLDRDDCDRRYPDISALDSVIAISGSTYEDKKSRFTAWGECMELLSPTRDSKRIAGIMTTDITGYKGYNYGSSTDLSDVDYTTKFGGTSAATPIAAGAFGLALSLRPDLSRDSVLELFTSTAAKIDPKTSKYSKKTGFSETHGYGRIDVYEAIKKLNNMK